MKSGYRTDIDGLRAIAVLAVVLFHINPVLVPGGFAGVDIFFVISGFLLTSIIHREKTAGTFSYANFYLRRIRRIVPALFVVVCATLLAGQFILLPQHLVELSKSAIASMLGAANVFFTYFVDTGYFAEDSATKPLLHIWSLGVEEQFYLIWPAAALFLVTSRRPLTIAIAVTLCLVLLSEWLVRIDTNFAYYMLPARAFELMIGASLAFVSYRPGNARTANVIGLAGLALIAVSLIFIDESWTFPGINALPSTLGAALVILSGSAGATLVSRALSIKPMRDIGKISYSLYLWHWPIVAFLHYAYAGISPAHGVIAFAAMIALSVASYRYVEEPCRNVQFSKAAIISLQLVLPMILVCGASVWLIAGQGAGMTTQEQRMRIASLEQASKPAYAYDYICQGTPLTSEMIADKKCIINGNTGKEPDVLLWGDSHAAHHVGILGSIAEKVGFAFRNAQSAACPPLLTEPERYASPGYSERCRQSSLLFEELVKPYKTIIIGGSWSTYLRREGFLFDFEQTVRKLVDQGKSIIILGQVPVMPAFDRDCLKKSVRLEALECDKRSSYPMEPESEINARLRSFQSISTKIHFIDFRDSICENGRCSPYAGDIPQYFDKRHLSMTGSWIIGKRFVEKKRMPSFFLDLAAID